MPADLLSDILTALHPSTQVVGALDLGGDWAISFPAHDGLKIFAIERGVASLRVEGEPCPLVLEADDCVILPSGRSFTLGREASFPAIEIGTIPEEIWRERIATVGGGGGTLILAGHFGFTGLQTTMLLGGIPPILRLRDKTTQGRIRWVLDLMRGELADGGPGSSSVIQHLSYLLLVQTLRLYLQEGANKTTGWLFALSDPQIARATKAIHAAPANQWTVERLASEAGMSRSKFAERFRSVTGSSPIDYLTRWRMTLACRELVSNQTKVGAVASALGYSSEAAFTTAFSRVIGCAPKRYTKTALLQPNK